MFRGKHVINIRYKHLFRRKAAIKSRRRRIWKANFKNIVNICNYTYVSITSLYRNIADSVASSYVPKLINNRNIVYTVLCNVVNIFKIYVISLLVSIAYLYYSIVFNSLDVNKNLIQCVILFFFFYWLMSGFNFFIKKYKFSKYTSAIQRFWKRSFVIFWLIESYLFLIFFFLMINASEESSNGYDFSRFPKIGYFSWKLFIIKIAVIAYIIFILDSTIKSNKNTYLFKNINKIAISLFMLVYIFWLEFYQFYYIVSTYKYIDWVYDISTNSWILEQQKYYTRVTNYYITICLIAKFFHIVFIFIFFLFSMYKFILEKDINFNLLSSNYQNFLILYILTWLYMYPWFKYFIKKIIDVPYYWFFINFKANILIEILLEMYLIIYSTIIYFSLV